MKGRVTGDKNPRGATANKSTTSMSQVSRIAGGKVEGPRGKRVGHVRHAHGKK